MSNRVIKFRAWDTTRKKYFSPEEMGADQLTIMPDGTGFINIHSGDRRLSQYFHHLIPEQSTGRRDKNGREIYDGDIVCVPNGMTPTQAMEMGVGHKEAVIVYFAANGCWRIRLIESDVPLIEDLLGEYDDAEIEIVGNSNENPELIWRTK